MSVEGVNIPSLVDTTVINAQTINTTNNNFFLSGSGQSINAAGISGSPLFTGTLGIQGLGTTVVTLATGANAYGFSGFYTISGTPHTVVPPLVTIGTSGAPQINGTVGVTGVGQAVVSIISGGGAYGFSGFMTVSGKEPHFGIAAQGFQNAAQIFSGEGGIGLRSIDVGTGIVIVYSGGGGAGGTSSVVLSYFLDIPFSGSGISESFVPQAWSFTGYSLGCGITGSGAPPMSGHFYTRSSANLVTNITGWTFESGLFAKTSGNVSISVPGNSRVGFSITGAPISGLRNFTLGVFGV